MTKKRMQCGILLFVGLQLFIFLGSAIEVGGEYSQDLGDVILEPALLGNNSCPATCQCAITGKATSITIKNCMENPLGALDGFLSSYSNATSLTIENSLLSALPSAVCNMAELILLDLRHNHLAALSWKCLHGLTQLQQLYVDSNNITVLENGTFYDLIHLTVISLTGNAIRKIEADVFTNVSRIPSLSKIDLTSNHLVELDSWVIMHRSRRVSIILRNNHLSYFTKSVKWSFTCMNTDGWLIDLRDNNITHITDMADAWNISEGNFLFCILTHKLALDFRDNPLICDCKDFRVYKYLKIIRKSVKSDELLCHKPDRFINMKVISIPIDQFVCDVKKACPGRCDCINTPSSLNMTIDCRQKQLTNMPSVLPARPKHNYMYYLRFEGNNLTTVEYKPYLEYVQCARFSYGLLTNVTSEALTAMVNLETFHLDDNRFPRLPEAFLKVNLSSRVSDLTFSGNPWVCDCHFRATKHWIDTHRDVISDTRALLCSYPERMRGRNILSISEQDLFCGDPPDLDKERLIIIGVSTPAVTIVITAIIIRILSSRRFRVHIYRTIKSHPFNRDECEGENKEFDVFVSYANEDEEFVGEYLIPELEKRGLKVCFHRIHFHPGKPISINAKDAVDISKRTLVFLSDRFVKSDWGMVEFDVAFYNDVDNDTHRLVVIKDVNLTLKSLDQRILTYSSTFTWVELESKHFWDNLMYALPVNKLGIEIMENTSQDLEAPSESDHQVAGSQPPQLGTINALQDPIGGDTNPLLP